MGIRDRATAALAQLLYGPAAARILANPPPAPQPPSPPKPLPAPRGFDIDPRHAIEIIDTYQHRAQLADRIRWGDGSQPNPNADRWI